MDRFYCENIIEGVIELTGPEAHHIASVKRLKPPQLIEIFDGKGSFANALIQKASSRKVVLEVSSIEKSHRSDRPEIIIAVSPPKGERFDWMISKCTELGADRIVPVIFERTVKQPKNPKAAFRWNNIAISACKQSKRLYLPVIDEPLKLDKSLKALKDKYPGAVFYLGSLDGECHSVMDGKNNSDTVCFIGPEGGFTVREYEIFETFGAKKIKLAENVLRIETAAVGFTAVLAAKAVGRAK